MKSKRTLKELQKAGPALLLVVIMLLLATLTRPARATFPAKNGRIAFIKAVDSLNAVVGDIFTVNPDGSDAKQLTYFGSSGASVGYENWSPDGRHLVFQLFDPNTGLGQLWLMNSDGSSQHPLMNDPSFNDAQPSFSPDGSQIVFARCGPTNCAIYRVGTDSTGLAALTPFDVNPDVFDFDPGYSPDGNTIAFTSSARDGILASIYFMNADGSNIRILTPPALEGWISDWSPDGTRVVFSTNLFTGVLDEEIWAINADGTRPTRLTNNNRDYRGYFAGPHDINPSWSPQGDAIVFERDAPDYSSSAIYIMNADGSGERSVLHGIRRTTPKTPPRSGNGAGKAGHGRFKLVQPEGIIPRWGAATN